MCSCWCDDEVEEEDIDDVIEEIESEEDDTPIDVTEEFAIPVRVDEEVEALR